MLRKGTKFSLYSSSLGNYFFGEIRELLAAGLRELGMRVSLRDERDGFSRDADWHLVVAPHEFFWLGRGAQVRMRPWPKRIVLYNTEQPGTQWYHLARQTFPHGRAVWDIDGQSAGQLAAQGLPCRHLPLGYASACALFQPVERLPEAYPTAHFGEEVLSGPAGGPLARRPLDLLFQGALTQRRGEFFGRHGRELSSYRTYIHLSDPGRPVVPGKTTAMDSRTLLGLAQRSKIVLNVHARQARFFEWHRIALHGIGQGALVVSEPCTRTPLLRPGRDFVEAPLQELPEALRHYLLSGAGRREAARIAAQGRETYTKRCRLRDLLRPLVAGLDRPAVRAAGKAAPPVVYSSREELPPVAAEVLLKAERPGPCPSVTVAVTLYDYERYAAECLDSVRDQTLARLDLVVVDDASRDGSAAAARAWLRREGARFGRCLLLRHRKNSGVSAARNTAFERARTPYVFTLDADNLLYPPCLERLSGALDRTFADFAYCPLSRFGEESGLMNTRPWKAEDLAAGNYIDAMVLLRRSAWESLGGYRTPTGMQGWEDYDFWLRLAKAGGWGILVPEVLAGYRVHLRSMLHSDTNPQVWRLMDYFRSRFSVTFDPAAPSGLSPSVFGARTLRPPAADGAARAAELRRLRSALALYHDRQRDG